MRKFSRFAITAMHSRLITRCSPPLWHHSIRLIRSISHNDIPTILRSRNLEAKRCKSWFKPLSKFKKPQNPSIKTSDNRQVIVEEDTLEELKDPRLSAIKHSLKTTDIPDRLRYKILADKLEWLISDYEFTKQVLPLINSVFMELYKLNEYVVVGNDKNSSLMPQESLIELLNKSLTALMNESDPTSLPEYVLILIQVLLTSDLPVDDSMLVKITLIASRLNNNSFNLSDTLLLLVKSGKISSDSFINELVDTLYLQGKLKLEIFEVISDLNQKSHIDLNDNYYMSLINYIESLYKDKGPKTHEYKDFELSIFRIQQCALDLIDKSPLKELKMETILSLLKLASDLQAANNHPESHKIITNVLDHFNSGDPNSVSETFLRQELANEDLVDTFITLTVSNGYKQLVDPLMNSISNNPMFYSKERVIQSRFYFIDHTSKQETLEFLQTEITQNIESEVPLDLTSLYLKVLQIVILGNRASPHSDFVHDLNEFFKTKGVEIPLSSYKLRLDKAIAESDHSAAFDIFNESGINLVQWSGQNESNPQNIKSLNDFIILSCEKIDDIGELFNLFVVIKQQMVNDTANVYAIRALAQRMLADECVGDCIELLKRELPSIDRDSALKLPTNQPFGFAYRELFDTLHDFVIKYTNEETFETNWVLYGELHKYFYVPFDSYLPAMKFFCEHNRWNAALIIFRQIKRLHESHGNHNYLPPSKEMYMHLFKEFGDNLYEEGVEEIHEYLKMDVSLPRQDIDLTNSLLNAYSNLQDVPKARDIFLSLSPLQQMKGVEGVNEETVRIMIKTYTYADINYVRTFWNNLSSFGVLPNYEIFKQYLIAHVYHGLPEDAIELTKEMDDYGLQVKEDTLVSMYNLCLSSHDQDKIEKWAKSTYNDDWNNIVSKNLLKRSDDYLPENDILLEGSKSLVK